MQRVLNPLLLFLFLITCPFKAIAEETIILANGEWPPYQSENLKHYGVASHIVTESFALSGIKVKYKFRPWKRAYEETREGEFHGSFLWTRSKERDKYFYFSDMLIEGTSVFFHLKNFSFDWNTVEDLEGIKIGGMLGSSYGEAIDKADRQGKIQIHRVNNEKQLFGMLLMGRIQIFPITIIPGYEILHKNFKPGEVRLITHHSKPTKKDIFHLMLSREIKKNQHYLKIFNQGLKHLRENGKYDRYIAASMRGEYEQK
ncbi:MAG: transporter substrate-binding domain-containing protein [Desulfobacterales bacterium]|nr:transporter substrate-binding domain-containing protein [Desulfobacterales bacterium]